MKTFFSLRCFAALCAVAAVTAVALRDARSQTVSLPNGSYTSSCTNINVSVTTLTAMCLSDDHKTLVTSSIPIPTPAPGLNIIVCKGKLLAATGGCPSD